MGVFVHRRSRWRSWFMAMLAGTLAMFLLATISPIQPAQAATPYLDYSLWVDGTSAHPSAHSGTSLAPSSGDFTVEMWASFEGSQASGASYYLWQTQNKALYLKNGNFWWLHDDGANYDTGVQMPHGWFHAAVTISSSTKTVKLYLNGAETAWSGTFSTLTYSATPFAATSFGSAPNNGSRWVGQLDQFKVFSSALSQSQISQSKDTWNASGISGSPTLLYHFDMNAALQTLRPAVGGDPYFSATSGLLTYKDVKTIDISSRASKTIYRFPRTYLNAEGGFKPSFGYSASYEFLAVAGGGGGGGNRGGGGGAGGLVTGNITLPFNGAFRVVVGSGGYSSANGGDTYIKNVNGSANLISVTGGGAGGTHGGTIDGAAGGSGGGASMCYITTYPAGGAATNGQGNSGGGTSSSECVGPPLESRHTGGGGGSGSAGTTGYGGSDDPSATTPSMTRPHGGSGTSSSISGTSTTYAAGGGGAVGLLSSEVGTMTYYSSYFGLGGSSIGGDGAAAGAKGGHATAFTGSGGGGGGNVASSTLTSGGYGSGGIVYLVASEGATLTTPAAVATLNAPTAIQPTVTVPTGNAAITGCSAVDANGSSSGVSVTCSVVRSNGSSATLTDLTFTSGTPGQYYTVIYTIENYDEIRQEMYLGYLPNSVRVMGSGASTNFVWVDNALFATSANQNVVVLASDVSARLNSASILIAADLTITQSTAVSGTTNGNGVAYKAKQIEIAENLTTTNGAITLWSTNPNSPTGAAGVTGVKLGGKDLISNGGNITIGGGANPATDPVTAEVGVQLDASSDITASGGSISIRANSVLNSNLSTSDYQMGGIKMSASNQVTTSGSGKISISANGDGPSNGKLSFGLAMFGFSNKIKTAGGNIDISTGNLGSGVVQPFLMDTLNEISTTGSGNITIFGDGRGSTTSTPAPSYKVYGIGVGVSSTGLNANYAKILTENGNITLTGYGSSHAGHATSGLSQSTGVYLGAATVQATGTGGISVSGTGGNINQASGSLAYSSGVETSSFINTTSGSISLAGTAGVVRGSASGRTYGVFTSKAALGASYNPGTIQTASGNIAILGDTMGAPSDTNAVQQYGLYNAAHKIKSTSGSISLTGTVCSSCMPGTDYGGTGYGIYSSPDVSGWHEVTTGATGTISIVGRVDNRATTSGSYIYGVFLTSENNIRNTIATASGSLNISGFTGGRASTATHFSRIKIYSESGLMSVLGTTSSVSTGSSSATNINDSILQTRSGNVSLKGLNQASVASGSSTDNIGLAVYNSKILSGDPSSSPAVAGGTISLEGQVFEDTTGRLTGIQWSGTTADSFGGTVSVIANAPSSVANSSRSGLRFVNLDSTIGQTSAAVNLKVHGSGTNSLALYQGPGRIVFFGGTNSSANVTIETDAWNSDSGNGEQALFDTSGWVEIKPIGTSFKASNNQSTANPAMMQNAFRPTARVSKFTIGKPGNQTGFTFNGTFTMSTDASNPAVGNLVIHAGKVNSIYAISANTLSLNSSGEVSLGASGNVFNRVALVRGTGTNFSVQNSATAWEAGTFNGVTGVYGVPAKFKFASTQPTTTEANALTSFSVASTDAYGIDISTVNTRKNDAVTVAVSRASGASTAIGGTTSVSGTAGGTITFNDITFDQTGNHTVAFDASGYAQLVSSAINVTAGPPSFSLSYFSGTNSTAFLSSSTTAAASLTTAATGSKTWSVVSGASVCSVNSSGTVTTLTAGTCDVRLATAADSNYSAGSITVTLTIEKANQSALTISSTSATYGTPLSLSTGSSGSGTGTVSFVVDSGTCSVSGTTLTLGNVGDSCMVTATKASDTNYNAISSASTNISVVRANQMTLSAPSGVTLGYSDVAGIDLSGLVFSGGSGDGTISFSTATSGCTVSANTLTSTKDAGQTCVLTATKAASQNYNSISASLTVTIAKAAMPSVSMTSASSVIWGTDLPLTYASATDGAATWSKVSGSNCTVSGTTLSSSGGGTCVIQVSFAEGTNYLAGASANFSVTLNKKNQASFAWSTSNTTLVYGGQRTLVTTGGSGTGAVIFTASSNSLCTVTGNVVVASADVGSLCEVTATKVADSNYNSADTTTLSFTIVKTSQAAISWTSSTTFTFGQTIAPNAVGGSGSGAITYGISNSTSNTAGCSISAGILSATSSGQCTITARKADSTNYLIGSGISTLITVNKASQTVGFTSSVPSSPIVGGTYNLAASASSGLTPAFSVLSGGCSLSGTVVTFTGAGNCQVAADVATTTQYLAAPQVVQTITVGQQNQNLAFDNATVNLTTKTFGDTAFAVQANSSVSALTPLFSRGPGTTNNACLVSSSGTVTVVAVGTCEILADQSGDSNTAPASTISKTFEVVADVANAPTIVSVSAGHQAITAAFVRPSYSGGAVISGYEIVATSSSGSVAFDGCLIVQGSDQSCTINGLTNGISYTVKVAAINAAGRGGFSAISQPRTPATNPAAVSTFTAIPDNTQLVLGWSDPISLGGGTFDSYRIFIKRSSEANYPSSYITVGSQSPTAYTISGLINGEAYDVKIVTVTTANTLALESNTAEVRETPRTVPDSPAALIVFEVGANLVISWSSPISDGGSAITEYAATLSGAPCVLANPTDTTCSTLAPSNPGTYAIEVKARNAAGFSAVVSQIFTRASASNGSSSSTSSPGSGANPLPGSGSGGAPGETNGGNESTVPGTPSMELISISKPKVSNNGGQMLTMVTKNTDGLKEVLVDGKKARIESSTSTRVVIVAPKNSNGPATITLRGANGQLVIVDAITYVNGKIKPSIVLVKGFIQEQTELSLERKKILKSGLTAASNAVAVTCIGYQSWSYDTPLDAWVALKRAQNACSYLKTIRPTLITKSVVARTTLLGTASRKLVVQYRGKN